MKLGKADSVEGDSFLMEACFVYLNYNGVTTRYEFSGMDPFMVKKVKTKNIGYNDGMFVINYRLGIIKDGKIEIGEEIYNEIYQ